jgi:DeoR family transcriptional regulator, deoxyribose operon repressor
MNIKEKRIEQLLELLKRKNAISIHDTGAALGVSEMTVRRYLDALAEQGIVTLLHGGAVLNQENYFTSYENRYLLSTEGSRNREKKNRIGAAAANLIEPDDIVIIDSGSTTEWLARFLPNEVPLRVLCYALNILIELHRHENCDITFAGGTLHRNTLMFESREGIETIRRFRSKRAFLSAGGIHRDLGITSSNYYEIEAKRAVMQSSLQKILLADASKFDQVSPNHYTDISGFDIVITDNGISDEYRELLKDSTIELITV